LETGSGAEAGAAVGATAAAVGATAAAVGAEADVAADAVEVAVSVAAHVAAQFCAIHVEYKGLVQSPVFFQTGQQLAAQLVCIQA
jgi:hypothetical protein